MLKKNGNFIMYKKKFIFFHLNLHIEYINDQKKCDALGLLFIF